MRLVFLDTAMMGGDIDLTPLKAFGELTTYDKTQASEVMERIAQADIVIVNKVKLGKAQIDAAKHLKLICVAATGMDPIDLVYAAERGIPVKNVAGYSTDSVAQTAFLHFLSVTQHGPYFNRYTHSDAYPASGVPTHFGGKYFHELCGKQLGIIGLGAIGRKVASIEIGRAHV